MVNWAIVVLIAIGFFIIYRSTGMKWGKTWTFAVWMIVLFFIVSFGYVLTLPQVDSGSLEGVMSAVKIYFIWLGSFFDNASTIAGQVIGTDWRGNITG